MMHLEPSAGCVIPCGVDLDRGAVAPSRQGERECGGFKMGLQWLSWTYSLLRGAVCAHWDYLNKQNCGRREAEAKSEEIIREAPIILFLRALALEP